MIRQVSGFEEGLVALVALVPPLLQVVPLDVVVQNGFNLVALVAPLASIDCYIFSVKLLNVSVQRAPPGKSLTTMITFM